MNHRAVFVVLVLCIAVVVSFSAMAVVEAEVIKIGIQDDANKDNYRPLIEHLENAGNDRCELVFYATIEELYRDFVARKIRLALVGPVLYAEANHDHGAVPLVKAQPGSSVIVVPEDSPIKTLEDLRGRRFALGYPESTTSNLIPRLILWQNTIDRADLVEDAKAFSPGSRTIFVEYLGSHGRVAEAVLGGQFDAGAVVDAVFERNRSRGLRALHTSEPYPGPPLICHGDEPESFKQKIRALFGSYRPSAGVGYHLFRDGVTPASDADYESIRYLCHIVLGKRY